MELTPIEEKNGYFFKRDDYYEFAGIRGGKVRSAKRLIEKGMEQGYSTFTSAGSKQSPQIVILSRISEYYKVNFVAHCPSGELSEELKSIQNNKFTQIIQHKPGYNSVIISRAKKYSKENNVYYIPFGMECREAIEQTQEQVYNIPSGVNRIVVPVGSGMSLAGILNGLEKYKMNHIPVLGVSVGADPIKRVQKFNPFFYSNFNIVYSKLDYHTYVKENQFEGIILDPIYEAKCIPFLEKGDLLWIVGIRNLEGV